MRQWLTAVIKPRALRTLGFIIFCSIFLLVYFFGHQLLSSLLHRLVVPSILAPLYVQIVDAVAFVLALLVASISINLLFRNSLGLQVKYYWRICLVLIGSLISKLILNLLLLFRRRPSLIIIIVVRTAIIYVFGGFLLYQIIFSGQQLKTDEQLYYNILISFIVFDIIFTLYQGLESTISGAFISTFAVIVVGLFFNIGMDIITVYSVILQKSSKGLLNHLINDARFLTAYYLAAGVISLISYLLYTLVFPSKDIKSLFQLPAWLRHFRLDYLGRYLSLLLLLSLLIFVTLYAISVGYWPVVLFLGVFLTSIVLGIETGRLITIRYRQAQASFAGIQPYLSVMARPLVGFVGTYFFIVAWFAVVYLQAQIHRWATFTPPLKNYEGALYYSGMVITTLGFSLSKPNTSLVQTLTFLEAITGTAWVVIVFAALISYLSPVFKEIGERTKLSPVLVQSSDGISVAFNSPIVVCKKGHSDFTTILAALKHVQAGACIQVHPGHYVESESLIVNQAVTLMGIGARASIVVEAIGGPCLTIATEDSVTVSGLSLHGRVSNGNTFPTINIPTGHLVLRDCELLSHALACIAIHGNSTWPTIQDCVIRGGSVGVLIDNSSHGELQGCDIIPSFGSIGIRILRQASPIIDTCQVSGSIVGVDIAAGATPKIKYCKLHHNSIGIQINAGGYPMIQGCRLNNNYRNGIIVEKGGEGSIYGCRIYHNHHNGITVKSTARPTIESCVIYKNGSVGMEIEHAAAGTIINNVLTANTRDAWMIHKVNMVRHEGNQPEWTDSV